MTRLYLTSYFVLLFLFFSCKQAVDLSPAVKDAPLVSYVNPFIGTDGTGHTFPGATLPFGMMQLSPDTRVDGSWEGCSGYHYSDEYIYGFSHTHLSGTGVSDYGDVLVMPSNEIIFNNGFDGKKGYRKPFSHDNETASVGYYSVLLDSINVKAELTVSYRSGKHRYTFPEGQKQVLIIDLEHRDEVLNSGLNLISETEISGFRYSKAWAEDQRLYFDAQFSKPYTHVTFHEDATSGKKVIAAFEFDETSGNVIELDLAISPVDIAGARKNRMAEIDGKSFEDIQTEAEEIWEKQLEKIIIETPNHDYKVIFYTAIYHAMIAPNIFTDVDGRYRGLDLEIHQAEDFDYYTVFSLWDTYRAVHPLYTIIEQERTNDFINTFLAKYDEAGIMPIWDLWSNETGCMIGYHAVPVIADAYMKGIRGYDANKALEAMKHSAMQDHLGLEAYKQMGYIPMEEESESVSKTLEYAYDDWTIAIMAKEMGRDDVYEKYLKRAQYYKNVFDPETHFMRARFRNTWFSPFDPYEVNSNYTEANAWQYSLYTPQDFTGLMNLMGGKEKLENYLDELFNAATETSGRHQVDITGLIGQYAHGNEPSHHMAYIYNFVNKPHKTQKRVRQILTDLYLNDPDGISGNEDCGQMSAWYIFSSLGFYPVTPGNNQYIMGAPLFDKATIYLENGKTFTVVATNNSPKKKYVSSVQLNGQPHTKSYINHESIVNGGTLVFNMTHQPTSWGTKDEDIPVTSIDEHLIIPSPFIQKGDVAFKEATEVSLACAEKDAVIYFRVNENAFEIYTAPFTISEDSTLETFSEKNGIKSAVISTQFYKMDPDLSITLGTEYANQYNGGGPDALIDGLRGTRDFRTGAWQGYQDTDLIATLNRGSKKPLNTVSINFLLDQRSWIFYPTEVHLYLSENGTDFKLHKTITLDAGKPAEHTKIKTITFDVGGKPVQHFRIVAKNFGDLPDWHLGAPFQGKAWLFVDEIEIK